VLNLLPVLLYVYSASLLAYSGILWVFIGFAAVALLNGMQLLRVFRRYDPSEQEETDEKKQ
jgi:hypothetical protein